MTKPIVERAALPTDKEHLAYLFDQVMANGYAGESFEMSLARLAEAVAKRGYDTLYPTYVWSTYRLNRELCARPYLTK